MTGSMERAIAETDRRREKQVAYNTGQRHHAGEHQAATSTTCMSSRLRAGPRHGRHRPRRATPHWSATTWRPSSPTWRSACATAAADLEFETAARLRDEIKRLRETELAIADDPLARQTEVEDKAGGFEGERKYGAQRQHAGGRPRECGASRIKTEYEPVQPTYAQSTAMPASRIKKPSLDDMGPGDAIRPRRRARARRTSIRAPRPARSAKPCAGRTSRRSTRWARTPSLPVRQRRAAAAAPGTHHRRADRAGKESPPRPPPQNRTAGAVTHQIKDNGASSANSSKRRLRLQDFMLSTQVFSGKSRVLKLFVNSPQEAIGTLFRSRSSKNTASLSLASPPQAGALGEYDLPLPPVPMIATWLLISSTFAMSGSSIDLLRL